MSKHIDPRELAMLDEEQAFLESTARKYRRIRVEKDEIYVVRFLPVEIGPKRWFYRRIAQHWISRRPYYCHRETPPECGGDPDAECLICEAAERVNREKNRDVSKEGFKSMANHQYILYCLLFEKEVRGHVDVTKKGARWDVWEFPMAKTSFAILLHQYRRSLKREPDRGFLNLENGNDIVVSQPGRDLAFEREAASPLASMKDPARFKEIVDTVMGGVPDFNLKEIGTVEQEKAIEILHEVAYKGSPTASRRTPSTTRVDEGDDDDRSRSRRGEEDDDLGQDEPPPRPRRREDDAESQPRRRAAAEEDPDGQPEAEDDPATEAEPTRPSSRRAASEAEDDPRPTRRAAPEPEDDRPSRLASRRATDRPPAEPMNEDDDLDYGPTPAPRSNVPPPPARKRTAPPPARATEPPPARRTRPVESSVGDEDNVADEATDKAPTAEEPVSEEETPPPRVNEKGASTPPDLKARLTRGIAAAKERL